MKLNFLKDPHTWVIIAMFLSAGLTAVASLLPADWSMLVSGILGITAIFIQQNK